MKLNEKRREETEEREKVETSSCSRRECLLAAQSVSNLAARLRKSVLFVFTFSAMTMTRRERAHTKTRQIESLFEAFASLIANFSNCTIFGVAFVYTSGTSSTTHSPSITHSFIHSQSCREFSFRAKIIMRLLLCLLFCFVLFFFYFVCYCYICVFLFKSCSMAPHTFCKF